MSRLVIAPSSWFRGVRYRLTVRRLVATERQLMSLASLGEQLDAETEMKLRLALLDEFNDIANTRQALSTRLVLKISFSSQTSMPLVRRALGQSLMWPCSKLSRDFSISSIAQRLTEGLSRTSGSRYVLRSRTRFILDVLSHPQIWLHSIRSSFLVVVDLDLSYRQAMTWPAGYFQRREPSDFITRLFFDPAQSPLAPTLNGLNVQLVPLESRITKGFQWPITRTLSVRAILSLLANHAFTEMDDSAVRGVLSTTPFHVYLPFLLSRPEPDQHERVHLLKQRVFSPHHRALQPVYSSSNIGSRDPYSLLDVDILHQRLIRSGDYLVTVESAADCRLDFVAGLWPYITGSPVRGDKCLVVAPLAETQFVDEAIAGFGRCDDNWFHFFLETVPRAMRAASLCPSDVPFLVRDDATPAGVEFLQRVTQRAVIVMSSDHIHVKKLHISNRASIVYDSQVLRETVGAFDADEIQTLRCLALELAPNHGESADKIVILRRSAYRRIRNFNSVLNLCRRNGFRFVDPGTLTLSEQIALVSNANQIVIQGGAAMTNLTFAPRDCRILCLVGPARQQDQYWQQLASAIGIRLDFAVGRECLIGQRGIPPLHRDFRVPMMQLRHWIQVRR